jgi:hypothetical protein
MEKSSQKAWKIVPLRHFFPLKVVPLIKVLLYNSSRGDFRLKNCENRIAPDLHTCNAAHTTAFHTILSVII